MTPDDTFTFTLNIGQPKKTGIGLGGIALVALVFYELSKKRKR